MKKLLLLLLIASSLSAFAENVKGGKCGASINGQPIRTVYIFGDQYNGVVWAYKHIAEETCLTPTTDLSKADVLLEVTRTWAPGQSSDPDPITVSCRSDVNSTLCVDSSGNELQTSCGPKGCSSYYGPSTYSAVSSAFSQWLSTRWYESDAYLYTTDHKLVWSSRDQKARFVDSLWPDKLRLGTNSPVCELGTWHSRHGVETYRKLATKKCDVEFDPLVSIDIRIKDKNEANGATQ